MKKLKVLKYKHFKFCPETRQFSGGFWDDVETVKGCMSQPIGHYETPSGDLAILNTEDFKKLKEELRQAIEQLVTTQSRLHKWVSSNTELNISRIFNDLFYLITLNPDLVVIESKIIIIRREKRSITLVKLAPNFDELISSADPNGLEGFSTEILKSKSYILMKILAHFTIHYFRHLNYARELYADWLVEHGNRFKPVAEFYTSLVKAIKSFQSDIKKRQSKELEPGCCIIS